MDRLQTLMLPSADPLIKQSSVGSMASALTGESWAWKLCRWCLWESSNTLIQPFLPPVISSCCLGAIESTVAPDSWQQKACTRLLAGVTRVSHRHTFLLSVERPAVAMRDEEPTKTKSLAVLLWHCRVRYGLGVLPLVLVCQRLKPPSASTIPNLFPWWLKRILVTLELPGLRKQMICWE